MKEKLSYESPVLELVPMNGDIIVTSFCPPEGMPSDCPPVMCGCEGYGGCSSEYCNNY